MSLPWLEPPWLSETGSSSYTFYSFVERICISGYVMYAAPCNVAPAVIWKTPCRVSALIRLHCKTFKCVNAFMRWAFAFRVYNDMGSVAHDCPQCALRPSTIMLVFSLCWLYWNARWHQHLARMLHESWSYCRVIYLFIVAYKLLLLMLCS